jgi:hypothetical protein
MDAGHFSLRGLVPSRPWNEANEPATKADQPIAVKADQILLRMTVHSGMKADGPATKADQTLE